MLSTVGTGGGLISSPDGTGGEGIGGLAELSLNGGAFSTTSSLSLSSDGRGATGQFGGDGEGGSSDIFVSSNGGSLSAAGF